MTSIIGKDPDWLHDSQNRTVLVRTDEVKLIKKDFYNSFTYYEGRTYKLNALDSDSVWQIQKVELINNELVKTFADNGNYNQVWNDRYTILPVDGSGSNLVVDPDNSYDLPIGYARVNDFQFITNVAQNVLTTISTYTVTTNTLFLDQIEVGGDNIAEYSVYFNGNLEAKRRLSWFNFTDYFKFSNYQLSLGDVIEVKVSHNSATLGSFESRLTGVTKP